MRISRINKYIFKECIGPFGVGTFFFTFIFVIDRVRSLVTLTMEKDTPFYITAQLFVYMIPFTTAITIPMGVLFGVLLAYGRLSSNCEIIAMRANGISIYKIFLPSAVFGLILTFLMFLFINYVVPESNYRYVTLRKSVVYSNPGIYLEDRVFSDLPNTTKQISTLHVSDDGQEMESVFIYELSEDKTKIKITYADEGKWINNSMNSPLITLQLLKGRTFEMGFDNFEEVQMLHFNEVHMNIKNKLRKVKPKNKSLREVSWSEVSRRIQEKIKQKKRVSSSYYVELHKKFSIPVACLVFVIIGMPLAVSFNRSGRGISFATAIIVIFIYYIFLNLGEVLGYRRIISPKLSMWLPNLVIFVLGLFFFYRKAKE